MDGPPEAQASGLTTLSSPSEENTLEHAAPSRPHPPTADEAAAWAHTLVRYGLLYAASPAPTGQWLVQHHADSPVQLLDGPTAMVELAADIQRQTPRTHTR
ncbi:hypothetical protein [Actinacidiphila sp. bgisy144]|uniref:hypothetical protein n=1 Tax=Actinacidiphila sp. bgisy144 TaxID=3413791 RepID=UPI003EC125AD